MDNISDPRSIKLVIADANLRALTTIENWRSVDATITQNQPGSGTVGAPQSEKIVTLADTPGNRIHLYHNGKLFTAGPIESRVQDQSGGIPGLKSISWTSDLVSLAGRLTAPDPANELSAQTKALYAATANAETLCRNLVNLNAGPGAVASRRIANLALGAANSPLAGTNASISAPLSQALTDSLRAVASAGGSLTFDVVLRRNVSTNAPELAFLVWAPADVSRLVRYTVGLNNLKSLSITSDAPTATIAIVGQESDPETTTVGTAIEVPNTADVATWGRVEQWVSSTADTSGTATEQQVQMEQDGTLALLNAAESVTVAAEVIDTPKRRYGVNYRLGDIVGIQPVIGPAIKDSVTAVHLTADPKTGVVVAPTIGTGSAQIGDVLIKKIHDIQIQLARLQAGR